MSACISSHGEYSEHVLDDLHTCTLCGVLDEDALRTELGQVREENGHLRALFDLQWTRMGEATELWRQEDFAARALVSPDLGVLLTWLLARRGMLVAAERKILEEAKAWAADWAAFGVDGPVSTTAALVPAVGALEQIEKSSVNDPVRHCERPERCAGCTESTCTKSERFARDHGWTPPAEPCDSCGGMRWVDDESWQPEDYERGRVPFRQPGSGRIPCGACNHGGWDEPDGAELEQLRQAAPDDGEDD